MTPDYHLNAGGLQVTQAQLQLLALAEELERVNGQLAAERRQQDALRRQALKLIASNEASRAEAAAELAAARSAAGPPPAGVAVVLAAQESGAALSPAAELAGHERRAAHLQPAAEQPPVSPAAERPAVEGTAAAEPAAPSAGRSPADVLAPGELQAAGNDGGATVEPPIWMVNHPAAQALPSKPKQARSGFWGSISAYITGADKLTEL